MREGERPDRRVGFVLSSRKWRGEAGASHRRLCRVGERRGGRPSPFLPPVAETTVGSWRIPYIFMSTCRHVDLRYPCVVERECCSSRPHVTAPTCRCVDNRAWRQAKRCRDGRDRAGGAGAGAERSCGGRHRQAGASDASTAPARRERTAARYMRSASRRRSDDRHSRRHIDMSSHRGEYVSACRLVELSMRLHVETARTVRTCAVAGVPETPQRPARRHRTAPNWKEKRPGNRASCRLRIATERGSWDGTGE